MESGAAAQHVDSNSKIIAPSFTLAAVRATLAVMRAYAARSLPLRITVLQALIPWMLVLGGGCASPYQYEPFFPGISPALGGTRGDHGAVRVFYATDRRDTGRAHAESRFGMERTTTLQLGDAVVTLPGTHGRGYWETAGLLEADNPARHIRIEELHDPVRFDAGFWDQVRDAVSRSEKRELLFFIHGYFTDFATAVSRAGQIAHDVKLDGPVIAYSWTSQAFFWGYAADSENVLWTEPYLTRFLESLVRESGAEHIHLLAHSMGTRALVRAIREMDRGLSGPAGPKFDQIVLAASDIDVELFARDFAPRLTRMANRTTIYVSNNDWALLGAERLFGYKRLGQLWALNKAEDLAGASLDRIDVVDVSAHDKGCYGHIYYGSSPRVLDDLVGIFSGKPPVERGLKKENDQYFMPPNAKPLFPSSAPAHETPLKSLNINNVGSIGAPPLRFSASALPGK